MAARGSGLHRIAAWAALAALALAIGLALAGGDRGATAANRAAEVAPAGESALAGPAPTGAAGAYRPPLIPPDRPVLWENRAPVRPGDAEFQAALEAAGAGEQRPGQPVVVLDPGHGGGETGAFMHGTDEAGSNLRFAFNLRTALRAAGVHVVLTREDDGLAALNFTGEPGRADLHARAEMAHFAEADLFISIHSNGVADAATRGLEVWYVRGDLGDGSNLALAERMLDSLAVELAAYGYAAPASTMDGRCIDKEPGFCDPLYVPAPFILLDASVARAWGREPGALGLSEDRRAPAPPVGERVTPAVHKYHGPIDLVDPETQTGPAAVLRGTLMPTVLVELLYMTNPHEAGILRDPAGRAALVRGMAGAILDALREQGKLPPAIRHQPTIDRQISTLDRSLPLR